MDRLRRHPAPRVAALGAGIGLVLGVSGAFGSEAAPIGVRTGAFVLTGVVLAFIGYGLSYGLGAVPSLAARRGARMALVATAMTFLTTLLSFAMVKASSPRVTWIDLPGFLLVSLVMSAVLTTLAFVLFREPKAAGGSTVVKFLDRVPLKLRGGELWAVEAEDHYLRLHTSKGQDLILLRLADAVAELEGLEGAQAHRSWWVARDAVVGVKRGDGRATLTLKDGSQVPVSRTFAATLRERGWF